MMLSSILIAVLAAMGCSKREREVQRQEITSESQAPTPGDSSSRSPQATPGPGHAVADTADSVAEIFSRIHEHESSLSQIIVSGRLSELAAEASRIRALLATAVKLMRVDSDLQGELELHASEATRLSKALAEAGKAGDADEAKARNADLQKEIAALQRMAVRPRL